MCTLLSYKMTYKLLPFVWPQGSIEKHNKYLFSYALHMPLFASP